GGDDHQPAGDRRISTRPRSLTPPYCHRPTQGSVAGRGSQAPNPNHERKRDMRERITSNEYHEEIERVVRDALEEAEGDADRARDLIWEEIDGHGWTTWTYRHLQVLEHASDPSNLLDDMGVDLTAAFKEGGMGKVTGILAFCAMMRDAEERLARLLE